jgi:homoserine kinase type II
MAALTEIAQPEMERLLERYGLGRLVRYRPASNGVENTNYFVEVAARRRYRQYVVTLLERPSNAGMLMVELLDTADAAGLPVARILRNTDGRSIDHAGGKPALVMPRLPGRHVVNPTTRHCRAVGRFLARFHCASLPLAERAPPYPRDGAWLQRHGGELLRRLPFDDRSLLERCIQVVAGMLQRGDVRALPQGVVHGDLFRDNVLFTERGLAGVVDFHHAARGFWLYDLAVAINDWCTESGGRLDTERTLAMLRGYHRQRRLLQEELWWLSAFMLYAAAAFWISRLNAALSGGSGKDPREFREIVRRRLAHDFHPDPRLIEPA